MTDNTALAHKERTLQDLIDDLTPEQRDLMDLVVGAAVEDEIIDDDQVVADYDALPEEIRLLIDFIVGGVLSQRDGGELSQDNLRVTTFLAHFGVKGMKWGVRNSDRPSGRSGGAAAKPARKPPPPLVGSGTAARLSGSTMNTKENRQAARKQVRRGNATAEVAHVAALKSTGHRVANAFLGDKSYWKGVALATGIVGAVGLAPAVLPASALGAIGAAVTGAAANSAVGVAAGSTVLTGSAYLGAQLAGTGLQIANLVRAVRGNSRIDASYERLGNAAVASTKKGMKQTAKILRKDGGLSRTKRALRQSDDLRVASFLEHHATASLGRMKSGV